MTAMGDGVVAAGGGRREELLRAARAVLAQNGYERTTVSSIATRANVAQGTFYLYVPSKEALPAALAEQMSEVMGDAALTACDASSLDEAMDALVTNSLAAAEQFRDVLMITNRGIELCEDFPGWLDVTAAWRAGIERLLTSFQERGEVDATIDVRTTSFLVRDLLDRAAKAQIIFDQREYADATVNLLRAALAR